jgi:uncharacterized protein (DUF924 family)
MHSERIQNWEKLLNFIERWKTLFINRSDSAKQAEVEEYKKYALLHHEVLERFGRYPHRNKVLERKSTEEEVEYLKKAETFGQ